jgi:hypothetical protein
MWLFTETGFLSAVRKDPNKPSVTVRARDKKSLSNLAKRFDLEIIKTPYADYPYRVEIDKKSFAEWVSDEVNAISYSNFKNQVAVTRDSKFAKLLGKVWSVMLDSEDGNARDRS